MLIGRYHFIQKTDAGFGSLGKQTVPIQSVAIRTGASAQVVHKTNETSSGLLRRLGMRNVIYMDDLWGGDQTMEEVAFQAVLTRKLLEYLGFVVNEEKSVISPQRTVEYLNKVHQFIKELGPNAGLDLRTFTLKLTMLMSLVSAARGQELQVLDISNLKPEPDRVVFEITEKTKTGRKLLEFP